MITTSQSGKETMNHSKPLQPILMNQCIRYKTHIPTPSISKNSMRNLHAWQWYMHCQMTMQLSHLRYSCSDFWTRSHFKTHSMLRKQTVNAVQHPPCQVRWNLQMWNQPDLYVLWKTGKLHTPLLNSNISKDQRRECWNPRSKGQKNVNKTNDTTMQPANTEKPSELSGRESWNQLTSSPTDTDQKWNADTGASAHMSPRWDWLCNYQPKCAQ